MDKFGMFEIGKAANRIIQKPDWETAQIRLADFVGEHEITGFLCLLGFGWLIPSYPNGTFVPTTEFIRRVCGEKAV